MSSHRRFGLVVLRSGVGLVAVYFLTYICLSLAGRYIDYNLGGQDNRYTWFPAMCARTHWGVLHETVVELTPLGWVYSPLIIADNYLIHRETEPPGGGGI